MKEIDEELVSQIKTVFENFDDEASENGWAKLREKYPEKENKKLPFWWLSGIAAAILLTIGLFLTLNKPAKKVDDEEQIVKQLPIITPKIDSIYDQETINNKDEGIIAAEKTTNKTIDFKNVEKSISSTAKKETLISKVEQALKQDIIINSKPNEPIKQNELTQQVIVANKVDTTQKKFDQNQIIANHTNAVNDTDFAKKTTADFLAEQSKILAQKPKEKQKTKETQNSIEVFSGTFLNYYADNNAKLNAGFGVNANLKLTKSLFVSFGAGISQNKISYQNSIPSNVSSSILSFDAVYASPNSSAGATSNTTITDVSINAQLLNFDLPLSLKFYPTKKQNFYISTGINSNTYFSQKYTYNYNLNNVNAFGIKQTQKQEEIEKSQVNGFDFANSAIFAIGINQNIGKNRLTFEPYFKPAIGNMGEKNLRINTVGLNLKFNFTSTTKK